MSLSQPSGSSVSVTSPLAAADGLQLLASTAVIREQEMRRKANVSPANESDYENDSTYSVFDAFYKSGGDRGVHEMFNFDSAQFHQF